MLWLVSLRLRDASIVDPFWGDGFVIVGWTAALAGELSGWGLMLALDDGLGPPAVAPLARRSLGHGEDFRYQSMRKRFPRFELTSLVIVFGLQGLLMWIVALPLQLAPAFEGSRDLLGAIGAAVWAVGLAFEAVGDAQLARFRADPANKGRVLDTGLWRYTRHPNYFGDVRLVGARRRARRRRALVDGRRAGRDDRAAAARLRRDPARALARAAPATDEYVRRTSAFVPRPPRAG